MRGRVDNAARYGAPVGKAAVGGDSMGGNFAAIIAQELRGTRVRKPPVLQLLIYPGRRSRQRHAIDARFRRCVSADGGDDRLFHEAISAGDADPSDPRISPGRTARSRGLAPALIYNAGFDMLLDQAQAYGDRLEEAGVKVTRVLFEDLPHGFVAFPSASPAAEAAIRRIARETAAALKGNA